MKYCTQCGSPLSVPSNHCPYCGAPTPYAAQAFSPESSSPAADTPPQAEESSTSSAAADPQPQAEAPAAAPQNDTPDASQPLQAENHSSSDEDPFFPPQSSAGAAGPHYSKAKYPAQGTSSLTAAQYLLTFLLFAIPVVGFIAMLLFAFSEPGNPRRELARGCLLFHLVLWALIGILILLGIVGLVHWFIPFLSSYDDSYSSYYNAPYYSEPYDDYDDWGDYFDYYYSDPSDYYTSPDDAPQHSM